MRNIQRRVTDLARKARDDKDLIKLNCVNDKLLQVKGHLRIAEDIKQQLQVAAAQGDAGARDHQFSKLTIIYQRVTVLGQEAEACVGEEISYVGETQVTVQEDPDIAGLGDPTEPDPTPLTPVRPPLASPTS
jgi:hypothetical protein